MKLTMNFSVHVLLLKVLWRWIERCGQSTCCKIIYLYETNNDFQCACRACKNLVEADREMWTEYMLQAGLLFKNSKICITRCSMRENLIQENHNGGMVGHFGSDKTYGQLRNFYFWPRMIFEFEKYVSRCRIYQHAKGKSQKKSLYTPFPVPTRP